MTAQAQGRKQRVSILLRTLNESQHLPEMLRAVQAQQVAADIEWILVDSGSTDATLDIAWQFGMAHILALPPAEFSFGRALNAAAGKASGEILVALSAHACPAHERWLAFLLGHFDSVQVGGVYGRQLPRRDAWPPVRVDYERCYGPESVVHESVANVFFSNANAACRRSLWERFPFDETLPACEDQAWARCVVDAGYRIVYDSRATVYHSHNESARVRPTGGRHGRPGLAADQWHRAGQLDNISIGVVCFEQGGHLTHLKHRRAWRWLLLSPGIASSGHLDGGTPNSERRPRTQSMRVLAVSSRYPPNYLGGYELACKEVMDRLRERGHEIHVLTSKGKDVGTLLLADGTWVHRDLDFAPLAQTQVEGIWARGMRERRNNAVCRECVNEIRPDVLSVWDMWAATQPANDVGTSGPADLCNLFALDVGLRRYAASVAGVLGSAASQGARPGSRESCATAWGAGSITLLRLPPIPD